jgi:hypothetical protein
MPVRVYGGFTEGWREPGKAILRSVIYRAEKGQYKIATRTNETIRVVDYPHWVAAHKWSGEFFAKPLQVRDEQEAWRFLHEPLVRVVGWSAIDLAPDLPEDFEYEWVEFDEDDRPR